jgi:uncharacterized membrane protein
MDRLFLRRVHGARQCSGCAVGKDVNRHGKLPASVTTGISMSIGRSSCCLRIDKESFPPLYITNWIVILSLAASIRLLLFTLWTSLCRCSVSVESGVLNNSMLVQIALLSWIFLRDALSIRDWISLLIATAGMVIGKPAKNPNLNNHRYVRMIPLLTEN